MVQDFVEETETRSKPPTVTCSESLFCAVCPGVFTSATKTFMRASTSARFSETWAPSAAQPGPSLAPASLVLTGVFWGPSFLGLGVVIVAFLQLLLLPSFFRFVGEAADDRIDGPLLDGVGQLVGRQASSGGRIGTKLAAAKVDVATRGEGACIDEAAEPVAHAAGYGGPLSRPSSSRASRASWPRRLVAGSSAATRRKHSIARSIEPESWQE